MKNLNFFKTAPDTLKSILKVEETLKGKLDPILTELIKIRASQINGCAYCLNVHTKDAIKIGETEQRIFLLNAWQDTNLFSEKEKLVLELTEKLTLLSNNRIDEDLYERLAKYFTNEDFANIVLIISQINVWNIMNIAASRDIK